MAGLRQAQTPEAVITPEVTMVAGLRQAQTPEAAMITEAVITEEATTATTIRRINHPRPLLSKEGRELLKFEHYY